MSVTVIIRSACAAAAVVTSLPCGAQIFGDLRPGAEARSFAPSGLLADPGIARWLMTLPSDAAREPAAAEPALEAELLDANPIGGEVFHLNAAGQATPKPATNAALDTRVFAATPIGGEAYRMTHRAEPSQAVAENAAAPEGVRPAMQGRSVAKRRIRRPHQVQTGDAHVFQRRRTSCHCELATGRSVSTRARRWQPTGEGHADLPAPRGPAGVVTIVPDPLQ